MNLDVTCCVASLMVGIAILKAKAKFQNNLFSLTQRLKGSAHPASEFLMFQNLAGIAVEFIEMRSLN